MYVWLNLVYARVHAADLGITKAKCEFILIISRTTKHVFSQILSSHKNELRHQFYGYGFCLPDVLEV